MGCVTSITHENNPTKPTKNNNDACVGNRGVKLPPFKGVLIPTNPNTSCITNETTHQSVCSIKHGDQHGINSTINRMDNFTSWKKRRKRMNELENFEPMKTELNMETELHRLHGLLEGLGILANEYNFGNSREANAIVSNIELAIERSEVLAENYEHLQIERRKQMDFIRQLAMKAQLIFEQKGRTA